MLCSEFANIKVTGIATAVPKKREVIAEKYSPVFGDKAVRQFSKTTGVVERRVAIEEQTASDLAYVAAERLLSGKRIDRKDIGICIFVTQTPDYRMPATACVLHKRLGLPKDCMAFDVNLGCSGYVYGMQIISALMQRIDTKYGLLLVGDTLNKQIDPLDASAVMLFGDSGSATLLEKGNSLSPIRTAYRTDGKGFKAIIIPAGAYRNRMASHDRRKWDDGNERSNYDLCMNGVDVFSFTITEVPALINEFMNANQIDREAVDCYAFHQANCYILKQLVKKAKLAEGKVHISMDRYGNTSVASIPLTLCDCYGGCSDGEAKKIFSCGFGIGLSWGIAAFEVDSDNILPIMESNDYFTEGGVVHA